MSEEVLINVGPGETRVAVVQGGRPVELIFERTMEDDLKAKTGRAGHSLLGNIFLGRVQRVLPGMQAAFVEIGLERAGFLGAREARCLCELTHLDEHILPPISACVTEGQTILVQAVKDPIGDKGARLSANVTIPGRLLVLVPNQSGVALSRRIEDEAERARLTALVEEMVARFGSIGVTGEPAGFIVRTAAIGATGEDIAADARQLAEEWRKVREIEKRSNPPSVVFHDLDPVSKTLRDYVNMDTARVLIDDADAFGEAQRYCRSAMPEMLDRVQLHNGPGSLFSLYDIDGEIESALEPRVELNSGGWITIETTEALTAIDVNSGRYTAATGLEETSAKINLEAVE
jgi:ribonuclease G